MSRSIQFEINSVSEIDELQRIAERRCLDKNANFTPMRRRVFCEVAANDRSIGAYDLTDLISTPLARVNVATVYKALDFLVEMGLVTKVKSNRAYALANLRLKPKKGAATITFVCRKTGVVKEVQSPLLSAVLRQEAENAGFTGISNAIEVEGMIRASHAGSGGLAE
ncbi:transcriptional repressor [Microvirga sp. CF3062]|uniref:transcriptional repressor n=1 Tax=Microvirga sp. CF3062 TaxID=3110182 RepID=UPI002E7A8837|nr:transcriptional repressor [Microvirga sp. CF3062]MEE1656930.1 transcriptional repressor [Microvirga sp. CF3062]